MTSAERRRAAVRDRWSNPRVIRAAVVLDWTCAGLLATALMVAGSLNL